VNLVGVELKYQPHTILVNTRPANPRHRLRWLLAGFIVLCAGICGRLAALEWRYGAEYRAEAVRPVERQRVIVAQRGRILGRDGTVLACDRPVLSLAMQYRWLEEPPDPAWLRSVARRHLTAAQRRDPEQEAAEQARLLAFREALHHQLAELCGMSPNQWQARCQKVQARVQALSDHVNRLAIAEAHEAQKNSLANSTAISWFSAAGRKLWDGLIRGSGSSQHPIVVAEQLEDHRLFDGVSLEAVAEIEANPEQFPGVRIVRDRRRNYPDGSLAAHLLGFVSGAEDIVAKDSKTSDRAGHAGVERQYDAVLRGAPGSVVDVLDRRGQPKSTRIVQPAVAGRDLVLTLDPALQRAAEAVLDAAVARRLSAIDATTLDGEITTSSAGATDRENREDHRPDKNQSDDTAPAGGGAILVMDIHTGAILAAASAPRFDPSLLADPQSAGAAWPRYRDDPDRPLFDRTVQMALPPGSVFKTLSAIALLETPGFDPEKPFECQGYLHTPDRQRCAVYRRWGVGHGQVTLTDALARSCNVYFFHFGEQTGMGSLLDWSRRCGFGRVSGIDLPGEAAGHLPMPDVTSNKHRATQDAAAAALAIGQSSLTVTPVQIVRLMAAVANGGGLVTPYVAAELANPPTADGNGDTVQADQGGVSPSESNSQVNHPPPQPILGLDPKRLATLRRGLRQVVTDSEGTAHGAFHATGIEVAGKTGTAEIGGGKAEHAWFAGYAPADAPRVAFVVVLERAGEAAVTAAPAAARLVEKLQSLGYFAPSPSPSVR
jgi:penicillin-binding protein 2